MAIKPTDVSMELPRLNIQTIELPLVGDTPLIVHAWSEKAKKQMRDKQMGKATAGKEKKDPERDFLESLYVISDDKVKIVDGVAIGGTFGFPVIGFKAAAVTACTSAGSITKVAARQAFHVFGDMKTTYAGKTQSSGEFVTIQGSMPRMREDMVRVGMGTADIRYRGEFFPWFVMLKIRFNANVLSAEQIANLFNTAGFGVGIGEWRAEKDGMHGQFHVAEAGEIDRLMKAAA